MKHSRNIVIAGSRTGTFVVAFGLAVGTVDCGGTPESVGTNDKGGPMDTGGGASETAWAREQFPSTWAIVQAFLKSQEQLSGRSISRVSVLYRPDVEGPAYLEFVLRKGSEDAGFIIASTAGHDAPIHAWAESGSGASRSLEKMHSRDLGGARIFVTGLAKLVAELPDGSVVANRSPINRDAWAVEKANLVRAPVRSAAYRVHVAQAWQRAARAAQAPLPPDVLPLCKTDGCGGDPCRAGLENWPECMNPGGGQWVARGGDIAWPPNYVQFMHDWWDGHCKSGCTPTTLTMVAGWISHQAGDHRTNSPWGHPRMAYAYDNWGPDTWAPQTAGTIELRADDDPMDWQPFFDIRNRLGTICEPGGESGVTRYTLPEDRIKTIMQTYLNDIGAPINVASLYHAGWESYYGAIKNEIQSGRPVVINGLDSPTGETSAHTWLLWGYSSTVFAEMFGMNLTWAGWGTVWWGIGSALQTITPTSYVGEGIVMFRPGTSRDHGPISTGAGSGYVLDVPWADQSDGAIVQQWSLSTAPYGTNTNQLWYLERDFTSAGWHIRAKHSGKCLAAWGNGGSYNGAQIVQWPCSGSDRNTLWHISKRGNKVVIKHDLSQRCLDLDNSGGMAGLGKKIQVWDCNEAANQRFDFGY